VLTDKARDVFKIMRNDRATLENRMLRGFTDEEKTQLRAFLKRLAANLEIREDI